MPELILKQESYQQIGACFEVYNHLGPGFLEPVYQECLEFEFEDQGIPCASQKKLRLRCKHHHLKATYVPDFLCFNKIIIEIKVANDLTGKHRAQVLNYLKATNLELGLLVNFGYPKKLQYERIVRFES